ncbi:MAG: OmpA family protein [Planctomycetes bacterium]|nr:OmpA family protein [Planctomycetota bacterium]
MPGEDRKLIELYRDQTRAIQQIDVAPDLTRTLRIMRGRPVTIVELEGAAAFRPGGVVLMAGEKGAARSALAGLAAALLVLRERPELLLLVAAHTQDEETSARRARNVLAFVRGDRAAWAADAHGGGRVEDWQQALGWVSSVRGWACDPGPADGKAGPNTKKALAEFRARWAAAAGQPAPAGDVGVADWAAFFDVYDEVLAQVVGEERAALAARRAGVETVRAPAGGCGAAWPPERVRIGDHVVAHADRVDLLLFAAKDAPALECHEAAACDWKRCDVYRKGKYRAVRPALPATGPVRVRLTGMLFETDKTFLLPRSLRSIKAFKRVYDKRAPGAVLVVGHTDTAGSDAYNLRLSVDRAEAVRAFLVDDADDWRARYAATGKSAPWGVREDKHMLARLKGDDGAPLYAGPIDANPTKDYQAAVKAFQAATNAKGGALTPSGTADASTRRALCAAYMAEDDTTLPAGTAIEVHGCGEFHPVKATGDGVADEENRRVEVFLFPQAVTPPARTPCPAPGCPEYALWLGALIDTIDLTDDLATLEVVVRDSFGKPVVDAKVEVESEQGADKGVTDAEGKLLLQDQLPGTYRVKVTKQGYLDATADAEAPGLVEVELVRVAPAVGWAIPGAVFLAGTACPGPGALGHIAWVQERAELTPERQVRIFAHTREAGSEAADKALSDRRARVLMALLSRDLDALDQVAAEEGWGLSHAQAMLRGVGCDPGPIDGAPGPYTQRALRGFQRDFNAGVFHRLAGLARLRPDVAVTGALDAPTAAALRDAFAACAVARGPVLPAAAFVQGGASGCAGFNPRDGEDPRGRVEVAVFVEPPPAAFPCKVGDAAACAVDSDTAPRCRFYREVLAPDDTQVLATFFDLQWRLDPEGGKAVFLSALTPLPDGAAVTFTVHRLRAAMPDPLPASWHRHERPDPGPALGAPAKGVVQGGVVTVAWTPPAGLDPFDWTAWFVDMREDPDQHPLQPPVFVVESGEHWAWSRPPGQRIETLRFKVGGERGGTAILDDGSLLPFTSLDGLPRARAAQVVAVHLQGHALTGVEHP